MHKKLSLTILALTLTVLTIFPAKSTPTTTLYVDPEMYYVTAVGQTFTINITVANVTDLWGWELKLFYSSAQLNGTAIEEGPFLKEAGETFFWIVNFTDNYNATYGYAYAFCILTHVIPGASGNGTLATITFKSKAHGGSSLDLTDTKIKNFAGDYIPHETRDGTVIIGKLGDLGGGVPPTFFQFDGEVDGKDYALFLRCYKGIAPPEAMYLADLGGGIPPKFFKFDGIVDSKDYALFLQCYKGVGPDP